MYRRAKLYEYNTTTFSVERDKAPSKGGKGYIGSSQQGRPYRPPYFFTDPIDGCGRDSVLWKPDIAKISRQQIFPSRTRKTISDLVCTFKRYIVNLHYS